MCLIRVDTHRLARREVVGTPPKPTLTDAQKATQAAIAEAYEALKDDTLGDPSVRRASEELATELVEQFDSLPIRVGVFNGKGEPYPGPNMSEAMRRDVVQNNHLFIYGTTPETFGPKGSSTTATHCCSHRDEWT